MKQFQGVISYCKIPNFVVIRTLYIISFVSNYVLERHLSLYKIVSQSNLFVILSQN